MCVRVVLREYCHVFTAKCVLCPVLHPLGAAAQVGSNQLAAPKAWSAGGSRQAGTRLGISLPNTNTGGCF